MSAELKTILRAYGYEKSKEAFVELHKEFVENLRSFKNEKAAKESLVLSGQNGWFEWEYKDRGEGFQMPEDHEWFVLNNKLFARKTAVRKPVGGVVSSESNGITDTERVLASEILEARKRPKTDLSMKPTDRVCITCQGTLAYEPICPGCRLGKLGFKGRYVCMDDMDHEFYVLREGVVLPNQGNIPAVN